MQWAIALAISLLLHAWIFLLSEPEGPKREPIELEIVEVPGKVDSAEKPAPVVPQGPQAGPRAGGGKRAHAPTVQSPPAKPPPEEPEKPSQEGRKLILEPRWSIITPPPAPPPEDQPHPEQQPEGKRIEDRIQGWIADDKAREIAQTQADPYWHDLQKRFERGFTPSMDMLESGPGGGIAPTLPGAYDGWRNEAQTFAATGNPYPDEPLAPGARTSMAQEERDNLLPPPLWGGAPERPGSVHSSFNHRLVTEVRLRQKTDGTIFEVAVHHSSGSPAFDRLAVETVREMSSDPGPTPTQGRTTIWEFDGTLSITPPMPIAGCAVDAYFMPQNCFYPLSRRLRHAVRLLAIYKD